jgi:transposase
MNKDETGHPISLPDWDHAHPEASMQSPIVIGLDIGKTELVAALGAAVRSRPWSTHQPGSLVVLKATGRSHLGIWNALTAAGIAVAVSNPRQVRHWIQSQGQRAKTDRLDATLLARYGVTRQPVPTPLPNQPKRTIAALVDQRQQLIKDATRLQHQLALADVQRHIGVLAARLKTARIACLRRFLGILNAMVREGLTWPETQVAQGVFLT